MGLRTKIIIALILSSLSYTTASAQNNSFAGIRIGYALPLGQFASHKFADGGYALLGKSIGVEAAWFVTPELGFGFDVSTKSFGFASGYYRDDYLENEKTYTSMELLSGPYSVKTFMGGVYYKVKHTNRFYSTFKASAGIYSARTPDRFFGVETGGVNITFWKSGSLDRTFGFLTGGSFEYRVFDHVNLLVQADYTYARPAFIFDNGEELYTIKMKMPVFQLLPGINIQF